MYVIYMDVLFMINFVMDTIIFWIVGMLVNQSIKVWRLIGGGLLAASLYCILVIVPFLQYVPYPLYSLMIPIMPILYIFKPIHFKQLLKYYGIAMLVAALLGGITFSLWYFMGKSTNSIRQLHALTLVGIGIVVGLIFYCSFYYIRKRLILPSFEYQLEFVQGEKRVRLRALLDTGNCLYTPITHKPVIVVEYNWVKELLTEEEQKIYEQFKNDLITLVEQKNHKMKYLIPFNSIGCETGMILGIEVDELIIKKMSLTRHFNKCIIGIAQMPLFNDHSYNALLHPEYILREVG